MEDEDEVDETVVASMDSFLNYASTHFPDCNGPALLHYSKVLYQDSASVELVFNQYVESGYFTFYTAGDTTQHYFSGTSIDSSRILWSDLPLNEEFDIYWDSDCEENPFFYRISTSVLWNQDAIHLPDSFFNVLNNYSLLETDTIKLNQHIRSSTSVSHHEKLSFFQQMYLGGLVYDSDFSSELPSENYLLEKMDDLGYNSDMVIDSTESAVVTDSIKPCNCKVVLNHSQYMYPTDGLNGARNYKSGDKTMEGLWYSAQMHGGWHFTRGNFGPAMYSHLATSGHKVNGERSRTVSNGLPDGGDTLFDGTTIHASHLYRMLCTNQEDIVEGCHCSRRVEIGWKYDVNIYSEARLGQTTLVLERKSHTKAENWTILTKSYGQNVITKQVGRRGIMARCQATVDTSWMTSIVRIATQIGALIAGDTLKPATITAIGNGIIGLLPGPNGYYLVNECENGSIIDATLVYGSDTLTVRTGDPVARVDLMSFYRFSGGGKRNWFNGSRIHSDFYLASSIQGGTQNTSTIDSVIPCCTQKTATYLKGTVDGAPMSESNLKSAMNSLFFSLLSPWAYVNYVTTNGLSNIAEKLDGHYGTLQGTIQEGTDCRIVDIFIHNNLPFQPIELTAMYELQVYSDHLTIVPVQPNEVPVIVNYSLIDMHGRILANGKQTFTDELQIPLSTNFSNFTPGIYIFHYQIGNEIPQTIKLNKI